MHCRFKVSISTPLSLFPGSLNMLGPLLGKILHSRADYPFAMFILSTCIAVCKYCGRALLELRLLAVADPKKWEIVASLPFVDVTRSPSALLRALYVPILSSRSNFFAQYVLLKRQ